jgi:ureidoglycolate dehydrogenase (NAD+)
MDWGVNNMGLETSNPDEVAYLLPIGKYKGFGLSMMIEILCSILTGMPYGRDITSMYTDPIEQKRFLGHFFLAINIESFQNIKDFKKRLKKLMDDVRNEPPIDQKNKVKVPGDPEKKEYKIRIKKGIPIDEVTMNEFNRIANEIGFNF